MISSAQRSGRRRQKRRPAGWLMVELESGGLGRYVSGRLVDTSAGGLGLIVDQPLADGSRVRVTRAAQNDLGDEQSGKEPAWERREAHTVHAAALPEGGYHVGLAFRPEPPPAREIWATRALLLGVFALIAAPGILAGWIGGWVIGALILGLDLAAEWQFHSESVKALEAQRRWDETPEPAQAQPDVWSISPAAVA
jgi:hypothetical protein